jgi:hypothetical protein
MEFGIACNFFHMDIISGFGGIRSSLDCNVKLSLCIFRGIIRDTTLKAPVLSKFPTISANPQQLQPSFLSQ